MKILGAIFAVLLLQGCAALEPNTIGIEGDHVSHISQHFGPHPTNYGYDAIALTAHWQIAGTRAYVELSEGYNLHNNYQMVNGAESCGALWGPHEVTTLRLGYTFRLKAER